jgi:hypothetical protein
MGPNAYGFDSLAGLAGPTAVDGVSGTLLGEAGIRGLGGPTGAGATSSSFTALGSKQRPGSVRLVSCVDCLGQTVTPTSNSQVQLVFLQTTVWLRLQLRQFP